MAVPALGLSCLCCMDPLDKTVMITITSYPNLRVRLMCTRPLCTVRNLPDISHPNSRAGSWNQIPYVNLLPLSLYSSFFFFFFVFSILPTPGNGNMGMQMILQLVMISESATKRPARFSGALASIDSRNWSPGRDDIGEPAGLSLRSLP